MNPIVRNIIAVLVGILLFMVGITGLHGLSSLLIEMPPFPEGEAATPEVLATLIEGLGPVQMLCALVSHIGGTFFGAWMAALISRDGKLIVPLVVALFAMAGGVMNVFVTPGQPLWFIVADISLYLPAGLLAGRLAQRNC